MGSRKQRSFSTTVYFDGDPTFRAGQFRAVMGRLFAQETTSKLQIRVLGKGSGGSSYFHEIDFDALDHVLDLKGRQFLFQSFLDAGVSVTFDARLGGVELWVSASEMDLVDQIVERLALELELGPMFKESRGARSIAETGEKIRGMIAEMDERKAKSEAAFAERSAALDKELVQAFEALAHNPQAQVAAQVEPLKVPEKMTLAWLGHNVPMSLWGVVVGAAVIVFLLGVAVGQSEFWSGVLAGVRGALGGQK